MINWKKIISFSVGAAMLMPTLSYAAELNDNDPYAANGDLSLLACAQKGSHDFSAFLSSIIASDGLKEGITEPFLDILARNQCQSNDIIGLIHAQDKIRSQIRKAFLSCETQNLPALTLAHHKLTAEIFYARNIVDGGLVLSLPYELYDSRDSDNAFVTDRNVLYAKMKAKYVDEDHWFSVNEFDDLFIQLELKYSDRKKTYIECSVGSWDVVAQRWKEFKKHFTEDYGGLKQAGNGIANAAKDLGDEVASAEFVQLFGDDGSVKDFAASLVKGQINGVAPADGLDEIYAKFLETAPNGNNAGPTQSEFLGAVFAENTAFGIDTIEAELKADFIVQYGPGSESVESFVNELDGRQSTGVEGLIEIINGTMPKLNRVLSGAKMMVDRQCPAS